MDQKIQISFPLGVVKTALTDAIDKRLDDLIKCSIDEAIEGYEIEEYIEKAVVQAFDDLNIVEDMLTAFDMQKSIAASFDRVVRAEIAEDIEHWISLAIWDVVEQNMSNLKAPKTPKSDADMVGFVIELSNLLADRDDYDEILKPKFVKLLNLIFTTQTQGE
mgnify:CR=1 FL=1|tara:strand:+ start:303 stop:788 length:486 start_codon:yes stop_codon:yes gene_type:complete